jgi:hypothetical protein
LKVVRSLLKSASRREESLKPRLLTAGTANCGDYCSRSHLSITIH